MKPISKRNITREESLCFKSKLYRMAFHFVWLLSCRWMPKHFGSNWKRFVLNMFGGVIERNVIIYSSCWIFDPRNLIMKEGSEIGPDSKIYNVDYVIMEENSIISQFAYLCTASHNTTSPLRPLVFSPIILKKDSWVAAKAIIGMGVTIGEGAIVALGSVVIKDVDPWTIVGGNPAKYIKERKYE